MNVRTFDTNDTFDTSMMSLDGKGFAGSVLENDAPRRRMTEHEEECASPRTRAAAKGATSGTDTSDNGRGNGSDDEAVLEAALPEAQGDPRPSTSDVLASSPEEEPLSGCTTPVSSIRTDISG